MSVKAGINQGIISSLFVLSGIFSAILAFLFLNEVMNLSQYIGMGFLIACAIVLSFSNAEDVMKEIPVEERIQSIFPVLIAIFSTTFLSGRSILCKYYVEKGYNVYNFAMQLLFIDGLIGTIGILIQYNMTDIVITNEVFYFSFSSGIIAWIGLWLLNYSIAIGIAGPASALSSLTTVVQTMMDYFILEQLLDSLQIMGLALGISGAITLAVRTEIINQMKTFFKDKNED